VRVLHCIYTLGGGGAERQLVYIARQMAEDGLETHVAFVKEGPNLKFLQQSNVILHALPHRAKYDPRMLLDLQKLISGLRPHIIQTWLTQMDILAGIAAWSESVPVVLSERSSEMGYPKNTRNLTRCFVGRRATAVVSNSEKGSAYWRRQRFQGKMTIIRNGVPFEQMRQARSCSRLPIGAGLMLSSDDKLILYAGRFWEGKNLEVLLEAFSLMLGRCENAIVVLFGQGPMLPKMQRLHSTLAHNGRVHICDYTNRLWEYMQRANLFISLSLFEGSPNVVLEAIAAECPLVLSDIPEHREIVDEDSALLVPGQDAEAVAEAMLQVIAHPEYASRLARRACARISDWSVDRAAQQYMGLYNWIVSERRMGM